MDMDWNFTVAGLDLLQYLLVCGWCLQNLLGTKWSFILSYHFLKETNKHNGALVLDSFTPFLNILSTCSPALFFSQFNQLLPTHLNNHFPESDLRLQLRNQIPGLCSWESWVQKQFCVESEWVKMAWLQYKIFLKYFNTFSTLWAGGGLMLRKIQWHAEQYGVGIMLWYLNNFSSGTLRIQNCLQINPFLERYHCEKQVTTTYRLQSIANLTTR